MSRWNLEQLAEALARNPSVRISRSERLQPLQSVEMPEGCDAMVVRVKTSPTKTKYRNEPVVHEDVRFDSKKELQRWLDLKVLERKGEIKNLERQVKISIDVNGQHICNYFADFQYHEKIPDRKGKWRIQVEDCKSDATRKLPTYRLKKKLVKALFAIDILET